MSRSSIVIGLGEIGQPIHELLSKNIKSQVVGFDIKYVSIDYVKDLTVEVMHICYPFQIKNFVGETTTYAEIFKPDLIIIHSTVEPGTSDKIYNITGINTVYSPVRGKHKTMLRDLSRYKKFIAGTNVKYAMVHLENGGFKTTIFGNSMRALQLVKLYQTTYFGLLIAWAQQLQRVQKVQGMQHVHISDFFDEIDYLPHKFFPGIIGGHCVMPNIDILRQHYPSLFLDAIIDSNKKRSQP